MIYKIFLIKLDLRNMKKFIFVFFIFQSRSKMKDKKITNRNKFVTTKQFLKIKRSIALNLEWYLKIVIKNTYSIFMSGF